MITFDAGQTRNTFSTGFLLGQFARNALMHLPGFSVLRKRIYSRQLNPSEQVFNHHQTEWNIFRSALHGAGVAIERANVVELGPGPVLANGINFIADGAASYAALDRYDLYRNDSVIRRTYERLIQSLPQERQARCSGLLARSSGKLFDERIKYLVGMAETASVQMPGQLFDIAISFNFMEHVDDFRAVISGIHHLLKIGGTMVHRVDVSTHDAPRSQYHPLTHLTVSDLAWRMMGARTRALPNRARPSEFIMAAESQGFETIRYDVVERLTVEAAEGIRPLLLPRFSGVPLPDLTTLAFVWVARKH